MYSSVLLFMNIGGPEMILIFLVVLLLFGGKKLPELARGLGKGLREFKDASDGIKREIHNNINAVNEEVNSATASVNQALEDIDNIADTKSDTASANTGGDTDAHTGDTDTSEEGIEEESGAPGTLNTEETRITH